MGKTLQKTGFKVLTFLILTVFIFSLTGAEICIANADELKAEASNSSNIEEILAAAKGIVSAKKTALNLSQDENLLSGSFLTLAGSASGDWYPIGMNRIGVEDDYSAYLSILKDLVREKYKEEGKLDSVKATEWHRISLAALASGGDPQRFTLDEEGSVINLIADGTYNRGKVTSLGKQGINGWIWGLIALDSKSYEVKDGSSYSREDIISEIIKSQLSDGGFSLGGDFGDIDITAMAVQALAPYYNDTEPYKYTDKEGNEAKKTVTETVDKALELISISQLADGDFSRSGEQNLESAAQVAVALTALGINPFEDGRFIKNGKTVFDGLMKYRLSDGGFGHAIKEDGTLMTSNSMSSEQALYALASLWRQQNGFRRLYDFRSEHSKELKDFILKLSNEISALGEEATQEQVTELLTAYFSIVKNERSYIYNFQKLYSFSSKLGIDIKQIETQTEVKYFNQGENLLDAEEVNMTKEDFAIFQSIPQSVTTGHYAAVITLLEKYSLGKEDVGQNDETVMAVAKLKEYRAGINEIKQEITYINETIADSLYPPEEVSLKKQGLVKDLFSRYGALSDYDKAQVTHWEDAVRAKTKLDTQVRSYIISGAVAVLAVALLAVIVIRAKVRRKNKDDINMYDGDDYDGDDNG